MHWDQYLSNTKATVNWMWWRVKLRCTLKCASSTLGLIHNFVDCGFCAYQMQKMKNWQKNCKSEIKTKYREFLVVAERQWVIHSSTIMHSNQKQYLHAVFSQFCPEDQRYFQSLKMKKYESTLITIKCLKYFLEMRSSF